MIISVNQNVPKQMSVVIVPLHIQVLFMKKQVYQFLLFAPVCRNHSVFTIYLLYRYLMEIISYLYSHMSCVCTVTWLALSRVLFDFLNKREYRRFNDFAV